MACLTLRAGVGQGGIEQQELSMILGGEAQGDLWQPYVPDTKAMSASVGNYSPDR
ncbi:hypothetical protein [Pontibacter mangrovi]|uniref:hypothetical protein n=1 Tax=Pontibacter mangrovi TaxID=2589816 RepID=UPI0015E3512E|nr:hypothetical protein [Pontibacter mangrovi]